MAANVTTHFCVTGLNNLIHNPEKVLGVCGVGLLLVGFAMQSIQYWVALLDVSVGK